MRWNPCLTPSWNASWTETFDANQLLHALAVEYLQQYRGDFEFLRTARYHVQATGSLPYSMARGVLNCIRNDWNWQTRLVETVSSAEEIEVAPVMKLFVVPDAPLPEMVTLPVKYNWLCLYSTHRLAKLVHLVEGKKSYAIWHRATNSITFHPYTYCQSVRHYWNPPSTRCSTCLRNPQPGGWPVNAASWLAGWTSTRTLSDGGANANLMDSQ